MKRKLDEAMAALSASRNENKRLKEAPPAAAASIVIVKAKSGRQSRKDNRTDGTVVLIKSSLKYNVWRFAKFIPDMERLEELAKWMYKKMDLKNKNAPGHEMQWVETYKGIILHEHGEHRSYVQNQMKKAAFQWMDAHGGVLPNVGTVYACVLRKIDMENAQQLEVFTWYYDSLLSKKRIMAYGLDIPCNTRAKEAHDVITQYFCLMPRF